MNWEAEATRQGVAEFFRTNAAVFGDLVVDDFYCTMDASPESEKARAGRDWGEYRRELLTGLIRPMMLEPARQARPDVRLDHRSLNTDTFDSIYVLMGHALPEEAQSHPVQRAGDAQAGVHPQVSNRGETAHSSGSVSFGFTVGPE
jgi:hypothetical protein